MTCSLIPLHLTSALTLLHFVSANAVLAFAGDYAKQCHFVINQMEKRKWGL